MDSTSRVLIAQASTPVKILAIAALAAEIAVSLLGAAARLICRRTRHGHQDLLGQLRKWHNTRRSIAPLAS